MSSWKPQYYEGCQEGLGCRFRLAMESATQKIAEAPFMYRVLQAPFRRHLLTKFRHPSLVGLHFVPLGT